MVERCITRYAGMPSPGGGLTCLLTFDISTTPQYCAKLLQAWGGELGTFRETKEGESFLAALVKISIKDIRGVIRKLIDQGLDKACPDRMDEEQLLVVMSATLRHMPLVTQLRQNTSVITKVLFPILHPKAWRNCPRYERCHVLYEPSRKRWTHQILT